MLGSQLQASNFGVFPFKSYTLPPFDATNLTVSVGSDLFFIDPATPFEGEQKRADKLVADCLQKGPFKRKAILLTHHHVDHVSDAYRLSQKHKLPIWAHAETARRVDFPVDRLLEHQEVIGPFECIFTPGHAPGHLCYYHAAHKTLVAGDMVAAKGSILVAPPDGHLATYLQSLQLLLTYDFDKIVPAHGEVLKNGHAQIEETIKHRQLRIDQIAKLLKSDGIDLSVKDITLKLYKGSLPDQMLPVAELSVLSTLIYLKERGVAWSPRQS